MDVGAVATATLSLLSFEAAPEIKTVIQEIIDNATWTPAKGIGLMHLNNSSDVTSQSPHLNALFLNLFQAATASDFGPNLGKIKLIVEI